MDKLRRSTGRDTVVNKDSAPIAIKASDRDLGIIEGYGSIPWQVDSYGEVTTPQTFNHTVGLRGPNGEDRILLRWEHQSTIGRFTELRQDSKGLFFQAEIADDGAEGTKARALLKKGVQLGASIGFRRVSSRPATEHDPLDFSRAPAWAKEAQLSDITVLTEVSLMEISIVSFPAVDGALVNTASYKTFSPAQARRAAQGRAVERMIQEFAPATTKAASSTASTRAVIEALATTETTTMKTIGQQFVASHAYKAAGSRNRLTEGAFTAQSILPDVGSLKALLSTGVGPTSLVQPHVLQEVFGASSLAAPVRSIFRAGATSSNRVTVLRENVVTNTAAEVDESIAVDDESGEKPESGVSFEEESFDVQTIAHWIPITTQTFDDAPLLATTINTVLLTGLEDRLALQVLLGNGTAPNLSGLLDHSDITVADDAYFTANPVHDAGFDNENLNRIRRAKSLVRTAGRARASFIIANPTDVEAWETATGTDGNYLVGPSRVLGSVGTLWGLPLYEDSNLAVGEALVGDGSKAVVIDRHDAQIYTTRSHEDFFVRNIIVLLAEMRAAFAVTRPAAFVHVELAS